MKCFASLLIAICLTNFVSGQKSKFNIGLEGGPSLIFLQGNVYGNIPDILSAGYSGGLALQFNLQDDYSIKSGINYERKGAYGDYPIHDPVGNIVGHGKDRINFTYLTVPALFRANYGTHTRFFLEAGGFFGYLLNQNDSYQNSVNSYTYSSLDNTTNFKTTDAGLALGIGCSIPIQKHLLFTTELRNNTGLINVAKQTSSDNPVVRTNATNLLLGIAYKL